MTFDPIFTMAMTTLTATLAVALFQLVSVRRDERAAKVRANARRELDARTRRR